MERISRKPNKLKPINIPSSTKGDPLLFLVKIRIKDLDGNLRNLIFIFSTDI